MFVTGYSRGGKSAGDYATVAYNAATGAQLWVKRYNGPGNGDDGAVSAAVSPSGGTVFVTGSSVGPSSEDDYATVAYNATTGAQRWVKRSNGPTNSKDHAHVSMAVSPTGNRVFVTGATSLTRISGSDYTTVAYYIPTGAQLWVKRYNGPDSGDDVAYAAAVSLTGGTVYVTGSSDTYGIPDYATVAYNAATGAQRWVKRYNGPANSDDSAHAVTVRPTGNRVFVTGRSLGAITGYDCATIAYSG